MGGSALLLVSVRLDRYGIQENFCCIRTQMPELFQLGCAELRSSPCHCPWLYLCAIDKTGVPGI